MSTRPIVDPLVGKTVAQYTILAKLGGGGMGVVYQARDAKLNRLVALKFLPPQWSHDDTAKQRFIREAQAASATDHPNICTIHDIESADDGQLFIVMAYYDGQTLKQRLEAGPVSVDEALQIATQVAEGLAKAHARGIVHRDIKPGNLMITDDRVKILDFGLAKFADTLQLTVAGSTLGTVAYMSPEQARGEEADARSDLWGVGVVLYEMLTGETPFKGIYPEAISYAIRNDPTPPLKAEERGIPGQVERLVLKALQKDPAERYQTARELARELRLAQGLTIPVDLRTEPVSVTKVEPAPASTGSRRRRLVLICATAFVLAAAGLSTWLFTPVPRMALAIAPVANQSGYTELDDYRLALTQTLSAALGESRTVRVTSYGRLLEIIRRFALTGTDVSSREAIQAIAANSGAQMIVVPTLLYENRAWRGRAEFRSAESAINTAVFETVPVVSSLSKDTAYALMASLAEGIEQHFQNNGPAKVRLVEQLRSIAGRRVPSMMPKLRTLEGAAEFERGLSAYEELRYADAKRSLANAAERDPENLLTFAWLGHIEQILQGKAAQQAADHAARLLTPQTPAIDALLVAAVSAESRGDYQTATARYRELAASRPDDPTWFMELGSFQYRRALWTDAVTSYRQAIDLDGRLARPHLELCRLYNRLNESASAKDEGDRALAAYRALGNRSGEGQALMCLTDMLRVGTEAQRGEARRDAEAAVKIFDELRDPYNLARGLYYIALAAEAQGRPLETVSVYEKSLATAKTAGNVPLEALDLMNLGAMYVKLGNYTRALEYYQQSQMLFERFGDESRAAQGQANIGAILVEYGGRLDEGRRDLDNALAVFRKLGDKKFEVFVAKVTAAMHRYAGRHGDAELELNRALALAKERDMTREIATLTIDLAESRYDLGDYVGAETLLLRARGNGGGKDSALARIQLARTYVRLARFDEARTELDEASKEIEANSDKGQLPFLHQALGELAYESGRLREARSHFGDGAALWIDELPDPSCVDARTYVGLLIALDGDPQRGRATVESAVEQAKHAGLYSVEVRGRIFLARIDIATGRHEAALNTLSTIVVDSVSDRAIGPELQAQVHYWRSRAMLALGDGAASASEASAARKFLQDLRSTVSEPYRDGFASRPDIRLIIQQTR